MDSQKKNPETGTPSAQLPPQDSSESGNAALLQDYILRENVAHTVRQGIPARTIGAKGSGLYGTFTVTHDISTFTRAKIFSKPGNSCSMFVRFSGMGSEKGSSDSFRDMRGFALKFYTEEGIWDIAGSNAPVFAIKDPAKFPAYMAAQNRDAITNLKNITAVWDFWSLNPESLHYLLMLMSDRGTPKGYRHLHGYGGHTFSMVNSGGQRVWVKFHFRTLQGSRNFSTTEADQIAAQSADFAQQDLHNAIEEGHFPKWKMYIQVMTEVQAKSFRWNPFDVTKVWFHDDFPLHEVGILELNEIPANYFSHVEQAVFTPGNLISGIGLSPDRLLQSRLFIYADAHRYRAGLNASQLDVNRCPFSKTDQPRNAVVSAVDMTSNEVADYGRSENEDDHYTQPGLFYTKALSDAQRNSLVQNIVNSMKQISGPRRIEVINRQLCHFFRANIDLGMRIAAGLQVEIDAAMFTHGKEGFAQ